MHGLATTAGIVTHTGVGGLTLGGGVGRLARKYGLACDNLLRMDVVTAGGEQVVATADENPDLFWALRGGGGNFGIVTAFTFRLHPVGTDVLFAAATHRIGDAAAALRFIADYAPAAPREVTSGARLFTGPDGAPCIGIGAIHIGPLDNAEAVLRPVVEFGAPVATDLRVRPYLDVQSDADELFPYGQRYYWKTHLLEAIPDEAVATIVDHFRSVPDLRAMIAFQQFGGAVRDVPPDATAFANRNAEWDFLPVGVWQDPADGPAQVAWCRALWEKMRPFASGGVYLNNLGEDADRVGEAVGANTARLARVKARWDPTNFFRLNANIPPAA